MDDEEEDMSRPISQLWGTPFRDIKYEDPSTQITAGQSHNNNSISAMLDYAHISLLSLSPWRTGERGEEDDRMAERLEEQAGASVEAQIGRKLREIGDKFHQDHFMRHQRQNLPAWMRLTMALFGFLFQREALFPRLRGAQR
uniref:Bcl-2-modifying factor-like n=1 Tax=Labrus bergylta TaxID=56723 RepID=A0A3Q3E4V6_9LABR